MTLAQQALDLDPYAFRMADGFVRRKTHHAPAFLRQGAGPSRIGFDLKRMMIAVDLDNALAGDTGEVRVVWPDWMLATELYPGHSILSQQFPYHLLGATAGPAELSRSISSFLGHEPPHPPRAYARVPSLSPASRRRGP